MAAGTITFGISTAPWLLFLGRVLQGFASALLYTVSLALLVDTVPREAVGKWLGMALSCNNVGLVLSPLFGGILYHAAGKYAVFGTTIALIAVDATLRVLMIEKPRYVRQREKNSAEKRGGDTSGSLDFVDSINVVCPAHKLLPAQRPSSRPRLSLEIPTTRLPGVLRLVRSPRTLAALYGIFLNECLNASLMAVIPLFVKNTFNWNTLQAGLIFLTIAIPSIGGFVAGGLSDRFGPKVVATSGLVIAGPTIILLQLVDHDSIKQMVLLCALLSITGK